MGFIWRLLRLGIVVVVVLAIVAAGLIALVTVRALPQTGGTLHVPGLDGPVTVIRDASGIARIYADTPHDLFLAQG
jgi:penicillin amidase